ncbi:MAG: hypothetical protein QM727_03110 [Niabella sp.]
MKHFIFIGIFFLIFYSAISQPDTSINIFSNCQHKKLYIQTDRESYIAGDTIWAKAFCSNSEPTCPLTTLIVDLFDLKTSKKISENVFPLLKNTSPFTIILKNDLPVGEYMLAAYSYTTSKTPAIVFSKDITVYNASNKTKEELEYDKELKFYPEGGNIIYGDTNNVAFKFADKMGRPFNISGKIYNQDGKQYCTLKSLHQGMGMLKIYPKSGEQYFAILDGDETKKKYPLPIASASGIITTIKPAANGIDYALKIVGTNSVQPSFAIVQTGRGQFYTIPLEKGSNIIKGNIYTKDFPSGVARFAIFTKDTQLLAERMFFVDNNEYVLPADLKITKLGTNPQEENLFSLDLQDPSFGTFAVSVTDADFETDTGKQNILSAHLLTSSLKEPVYNPGLYFDKYYNNTTELLDLIVQTNYWSPDKWGDISKTSFPQSSMIEVTGIISGTVFYKNTKRVYANKQVSLVTLSDTDSTTQTALFTTDSNGRFKTEPLNLIGTNRLTFSPATSNKNDFIAVTLNKSSFSDSLFRFPEAIHVKKENTFTPSNKYDSILNSKEYLEKVTVKSKLPDKSKLLEQKYTTGKFNYSPGQVYDMRAVDSPKMTLLDYLSYRYADLYITPTSTGNYLVTARTKKGDFAFCRIYLDEVEVWDNQQLYSIYANDIAMIKIIYSFDYGIDGDIPALSIYTRKGTDFTASNKNYDIKYYNGFSTVHQFYSPVYSPDQISKDNDQRITLLWNPKAATSKRVSFIPIHFYNNNYTRHFKIVIEGITENGKLLYFKKTL